ncbi:MAG: hypothetical protein M3021_12390 [Actinomycetota bacterium]|nr:hypothetical protein [Actinomycetota bacterium]
MFDALSFAELEGQHVELLPARTVLSMVTGTTGGTGTAAAPTGGIPAADISSGPARSTADPVGTLTSGNRFVCVNRVLL